MPTKNCEMKTLTLSSGKTLAYELTRKRVKNINCRLKSDGIVYVSANSRVPVAEIERFLVEKADVFFNAYENIKKHKEKSEINTRSVNFLGKEYPVRIIQNSRETAVFDETECRVFTRLSEPENVLLLIKRAVSEHFLNLCREINAEVLDELKLNGLKPPPTQITIKDMTSRWGSCSYTRGHISINSRLVAYPRETIKAVFWHEYTHYWHHDHSKAFYDFLTKYYPEYFKWHDFLKE